MDKYIVMQNSIYCPWLEKQNMNLQAKTCLLLKTVFDSE